jgi:hypothetical protein
MTSNSQIITFQTEDGQTKIDVRLEDRICLDHSSTNDRVIWKVNKNNF